MKNLLLLILFCGSLNAQKLLDVVYFPPSSLEEANEGFLRMINSLNVNNIKRMSHLDSAAAYHARYLFERNKGLLNGSQRNTYLSHYETEDLDNFIEKRKPSDRTGHPWTLEICLDEVWHGGEFLNGQNAQLIKMIENNTNASDLFNYLGESFNAKNIYETYKSSSSHYAIMKSKDVGYFGSKTMLFGAARFYKNDNEDDLMRYTFYLVNVTVFLDKTISQSIIEQLKGVH